MTYELNAELISAMCGDFARFRNYDGTECFSSSKVTKVNTQGPKVLVFTENGDIYVAFHRR